MDNPYWSSSDNIHHIDFIEIRRKCFELSNIFLGSESLCKYLRYQEEDDEYEGNIASENLYKLHTEFSHMEISKLLLQIAFMLRTYDDVMLSSPDSEEYKLHRKKTSGTDFIGILPDNSDIRTACNKIIHARTIRPLYKRLEDGEGEDIWCLTGEIELNGIDKNNQWNVTIFIQEFIDIALDRISFSSNI